MDTLKSSLFIKNMEFNDLPVQIQKINKQIIATSFDKNLYAYLDIKQFLIYLSDIIQKDNATICYIGAASNDDPTYLKAF